MSVLAAVQKSRAEAEAIEHAELHIQEEPGFVDDKNYPKELVEAPKI